jgi:hypothetical protein
VGTRSYGIYLWHWPVIALGTALAAPGAVSPWLWPVEIAVTIALAAASWRYVETPILRDGLRATVRRWLGLVAQAARRPGRPAGTSGRAVPVTVAAATALAVVVAGYGLARPAASAEPSGLLQQVADGQRVTAASPRASSSPPAASLPACRRGPHGVAGGEVTAVGDSVMLASAAALERLLPGVYIDAKLDRQMSAGLAAIQNLAAAGRLRPLVVIGLGTNGDVTAAQLRQLRRLIGPGRELVLVNTFGPESWEHEVNVALGAAARHFRHTQLADWYQAIAPRTDLLWPDGIHPRPAGAALYAHVVIKALKAGLSRSVPACSAGS